MFLKTKKTVIQQIKVCKVLDKLTFKPVDCNLCKEKVS